MAVVIQSSPVYRNFELEVRAQRAEALVGLLSAAWKHVRLMFATPPAARGAQARAIGLAWLRAS